jgi:hypothetical protein
VQHPPGMCGELCAFALRMAQWTSIVYAPRAEQMPKIDHNQHFFGPDIAELAINTRSNCQIPHHAHPRNAAFRLSLSLQISALTRARICKSPAVLSVFLLYVFASQQQKQSVFLLSRLFVIRRRSRRYCQCLHSDVKFFNLVVKPTRSQ